MDVTTVIGIMLGVGCILLGQVLEGGHVGSIVQGTAAIIVIGGTMGAVVTQFPLAELARALRQAKAALTNAKEPLEPLVARLVELARKSRREGLLVLEDEAESSPDPFFRRAVLALIDGNDAGRLRTLLEHALDQEEHFQEPGPKLFEAAGGYAPTVGILGAVLGLIHVMENLSDPSKLGPGIAVAFVATIYGVGSANLIFLPLAEKLKMKVREDLRRKELIVEGVCSIQEGINPQMIQKHLSSFVERQPEQAPIEGELALEP